MLINSKYSKYLLYRAVAWRVIKYVYCRGSNATLFGRKALISGYILGVNAFFFALQHSCGSLQSTYSKNYLVETIPINEYNINAWE